MFPKGKSSSVPSDNQAKEKLANYVYEYLIHNGATKAAQIFLQEIHWDKPWPVGEPPGFLNQWWCVFYDLYNAAPERRESFEHSSEAKAFHDYGFVNAGFPNGLARNPSIASPISGGMPPSGGRPPSSQGIMPPDNGIHTPVSIPGGGQMMLPNTHFFAPTHPISNLGNPGMDILRTRPMMQHPGMRFPPGNQMMANYHPSQNMNRHRYNQPQSAGIIHSPGPSGTPQTGPPIMSSPNDNLQNEGQQNNSGQDSSFGPNGPSSRSPSHVMSQPAPAFPPPPASENNSDQSHNPGLMNGSTPTIPQFSQHQQSHTMEYLPSNNMSFDPPQSMKHSPQLHNSMMGDVIASMGNSMPNDAFCNPMIPNGPTPFSPEQNIRLQQHMMQHGMVQSHHGPLTMMPGGPSLPPSFMSHAGVPISASPQFPVGDDYFLNKS